MTKTIYGIDPDKKFNSNDVKKAIIKCFKEAHKEILDEYESYDTTNMSKEEIEKIKTLNIEILIKKFLKEAGGDPKNPSKEDLENLCDKLAEFAKNFRSDDIIKKNYNKIMKLVKKLN